MAKRDFFWITWHQSPGPAIADHGTMGGVR